MATYTLDFERPLLEIEKQIEELKRNGGEQGADTGPLERQLARLGPRLWEPIRVSRRRSEGRRRRSPTTWWRWRRCEHRRSRRSSAKAAQAARWRGGSPTAC